MPFRVPLVLVSGSPINVEQCDEPSNEQIDDLHAQFLSEIKNLFESHKALYGWQHKVLVFK